MNPSVENATCISFCGFNLTRTIKMLIRLYLKILEVYAYIYLKLFPSNYSFMKLETEDFQEYIVERFRYKSMEYKVRLKDYLAKNILEYYEKGQDATTSERPSILLATLNYDETTDGGLDVTNYLKMYHGPFYDFFDKLGNKRYPLRLDPILIYEMGGDPSHKEYTLTITDRKIHTRQFNYGEEIYF